jgi:phage shock protein A
MEKKPEDLSGMDAASAKEYILHYMTGLNLTKKKIEDLDKDILKWKSREELAAARLASALEEEARAQAGALTAQRAVLQQEADEWEAQIKNMRAQLPGLAARERSIDPDLLEQELLIAAGRMPGDDEKRDSEQALEDLEKQSAVDTELAALKARMAMAGTAAAPDREAGEPQAGSQGGGL